MARRTWAGHGGRRSGPQSGSGNPLVETSPLETIAVSTLVSTPTSGDLSPAFTSPWALGAASIAAELTSLTNSRPRQPSIPARPEGGNLPGWKLAQER